MQRVVCMHGPGRRIVDFAVVQLGGHVAKYEDACREADRTDTWYIKPSWRTSKSNENDTEKFTKSNAS
ncbi:hypothetical protein PC128_g19582 [Phytophthora cactorum]|nr:hypothetical protein PC128_g19582 [Phytophthora cactorum]